MGEESKPSLPASVPTQPPPQGPPGRDIRQDPSPVRPTKPISR